jgi:hypothetical protein
MTENIEEENTKNELLSIIWGCVGLGVILTIAWNTFTSTSDKPFLGKESITSKAEIDSLVGLSTSELRQKLGKPNFVILKEGSSLTPRSPGSTKIEPDETWHYLDKVKHKASGTTMGLSCDVRDGRCVAAKVR